MGARTTPEQRQQFFQFHLRGDTYREIAEHFSVCEECVRYWCRRQRAGGSPLTCYGHRPPGQLASFDALVRYCILRLRLAHPHRGPNRILAELQKRPSVCKLPLPSEASIGRYLHQWPKFRRRCKTKPPTVRPNQPTAVHQRWQLDFKLGIALRDGNLANLHTVRDPFGEVCLGAYVFAAGHIGQRPERATVQQIQAVLRACFARWHTLPDELQTDGEGVLIGRPQDEFPSRLTLWLVGLAIKHFITRPGRPTDNAEVERCHRTIMDYAVIGNEGCAVPQLQVILDKAVHEMAYELSSRAEGCQGRPPVQAHPELLQPRRPFQLEYELALFDLKRVDAYLATFTWERKVGDTGQVTIGGKAERYSVGRAYARQKILVRFDPTDRSFVFYKPEQPECEIRRRPAKRLGVDDLTGIIALPSGTVPQQLPLPWPFSKGYVVNEQTGV